MITPSTLFQASPDVIGAEVNAGLVLLNVKDWVYLDLNETGNFLWDRLQSPQTLIALTQAVTEAFEVDAETCGVQIQTFLNDLNARGFVTLQG
ncbi:PqqD family protein [Pseudomonas sp. LRF_L74]|uniref:PqqD family protein n=1 Tax=Pseudomonas sp. LRF_L74 TaxID=3369422 RepID=UPI003F5EC5F6